MYTDVKLVRYPPSHGLLGRLSHRRDSGLVLFHRAFKPRTELDQLERYASELEQVARHGNDGSLGCFVETESHDGVVEITLYERWFDGQRLRCEQLANREFDPEREDALVASAEFRGQLETWAEDRNAERETSYLDAAADDSARIARATEHRQAADELAGILAR
jgi:hypothetical protein